MTSLQRRIHQLEATMAAMMQDNDSNPADLSMLSIEGLEALQKVLDYTVAREAAAQTSKRALVADPSGLAADDMAVYLQMVQRAERRTAALV
jgi:hypothetical protein